MINIKVLPVRGVVTREAERGVYLRWADAPHQGAIQLIMVDDVLDCRLEDLGQYFPGHVVDLDSHEELPGAREYERIFSIRLYPR